MIYSVRGRIAAVEPNMAVVECAGVGYAVRTSSVTVSRLPSIGEEAMLYTYLHISENAAELLVPLIADMHTGENWYEAK